MGTSRSSFGKCSGWWSCQSWVRVPLNSWFPQGFSPIFFSCRYCSCCLTRGCTTMVRVTCPLRSKPGVDFGYLSTTWSFLGIGCRSSLCTVCVRECGGVSLCVSSDATTCTWRIEVSKKNREKGWSYFFSNRGTSLFPLLKRKYNRPLPEGDPKDTTG